MGREKSSAHCDIGRRKSQREVERETGGSQDKQCEKERNVKFGNWEESEEREREINYRFVRWPV